MFNFHDSQYADLRRRSGALLFLSEDGKDPPERLLQAVWFHQRILREKLLTTDGRAVQILHPGFWNHEAGPDFRRAVVRFDGEAPSVGDVELDLRSADWRGHGHHANPAFKNVVLHVVWDGEDCTGQRTLVLKPLLDSPLPELAIWLGSETARSFPLELLGRCCAPLREFEPARLRGLLHQAALIRFQAKAAQLQARAREAGWEQALWEGLFRALGYKQNLWPMQRLGELRARLCPAREPLDVFTLQARLLGMAGILPRELTRHRSGNDRYLRRLWDCWWRERESFADCTLPRSLWKFSGIRPANHPQRRLALAAHWLVDAKLPSRLENWCARSIEPPRQAAALLDCFQVEPDTFWFHHWTLNSARLERPQLLLGSTRVTDLAVNVVLPWLWIRAVEGQNETLRTELERRYFSWPSSEDNAVLRLARQRLLGPSSSARVLRGSAEQQGLLQIVRDFCEHTNALCAECQFPGLVRTWSV